MPFLVDKQLFTAFIEETLQKEKIHGSEFGEKLNTLIKNKNESQTNLDRIKFLCTDVLYRLTSDKNAILKKDINENYKIIGKPLNMYNEYNFNKTVYMIKIEKVLVFLGELLRGYLSALGIFSLVSVKMEGNDLVLCIDNRECIAEELNNHKE